MRKFLFIFCLMTVCFISNLYAYEDARLFYKDKTTGDWVAVKGEAGKIFAEIVSSIQIDSMSLTLDTAGLASATQLNSIINLLNDSSQFITDTNITILNLTLKNQNNAFSSIEDKGILGFGIDKNTNLWQVFYIDDKRLQTVDKNSDTIFALLNNINLKADTDNYYIFYDSSTFVFDNVEYYDLFGNIKIDSDVVSSVVEKIKLPYTTKVTQKYIYYTNSEVLDRRLGKLKNIIIEW